MDQDLMVHFGLEEADKKLLCPENFPLGSKFVSAVQNRMLQITGWQQAADGAHIAFMVRSNPGDSVLGTEEVKHEIRKEVWVYAVPGQDTTPEEDPGNLGEDDLDADNDFGEDLTTEPEEVIDEETAGDEDGDIRAPEEVVIPEPEPVPDPVADEVEAEVEADVEVVAEPEPEVELVETEEVPLKNPAEAVGDIHYYANGVPNPDPREDGSRKYKVIADETLGKPGNKSHLVMYCASRGMLVNEAVKLGIDQQLYQNIASGRGMFLRVVRKLKTMGWGVFFDEEKDMVWLSEDGLTPYIPDVTHATEYPTSEGDALAAKVRMNMGIKGPRDLPRPLQHALAGMEDELSTLPKRHAAGIAHLAYGIYLLIHGD